MIKILTGQILIYILLFLIILFKIDDFIPMSLISLIILASYVYIGYFASKTEIKTRNYFILSLIGLIFLIVALIISPNYFFTKTIDSSNIWLLVDLYLSPLESIRFWLKVDSLKYASLSTYLIEILLIGILPYLGKLLKINLIKKTATNNGLAQ